MWNSTEAMRISAACPLFLLKVIKVPFGGFACGRRNSLRLWELFFFFFFSCSKQQRGSWWKSPEKEYQVLGMGLASFLVWKKNNREHFQLKYKVFLPRGTIIVVKCQSMETLSISLWFWNFPELLMQQHYPVLL